MQFGEAFLITGDAIKLKDFSWRYRTLIKCVHTCVAKSKNFGFRFKKKKIKTKNAIL